MIDLENTRREIEDWYVHCDFPTSADEKAWIEQTPQAITARRYSAEVLRLVSVARTLLAEVERLRAQVDNACPHDEWYDITDRLAQVRYAVCAKCDTPVHPQTGRPL